MPARIWNLAVGAAAWAPTLVILAALGALAIWGRYNDWQLSPARSGESAAAKQAPEEPAIKIVAASAKPGPGTDAVSAATPASEPVRIEFASASAVEKVGIKVVPVRVQALTQAVSAPGMVDYEPGRYARLTARASGSVVRVHKEINDPIRKGDVLALLDAAEVGRCKADLLQDLAQVQLHSAKMLRWQGLDDVISQSTRQLAKAALREAQIRIINHQQALLNLGLPVRLEDLEKLSDDRLARALRLLGLPEAAVRGFDPETLTANLLPLMAPFDGVVVERNVAVGEVVQSSQPKTLFVVADVRQVHVDLDVNPEDMAEVRVGQPITFRPNDGGAAVAGQVSHISPEVNDKTRRVQVHAEVPNKNRRLRPNTFGTGQIVVAQKTKAIVVPGEAVQSDGQGSLVFVRLSPTSFQVRPVHLGFRQGDLVEVSGVRAGEEVVTTGSFLLRSELQKDRIGGGDE